MAEELFLFWADETDLDWRAESAGLREDMSKSPNEGPISKHAVRMLSGDEYPIRSAGRFPRSATLEQLHNSDLLICMYRKEHEPMFNKRFPDYEGDILYWNVPDVEYMEPEKAYAIIKNEVRQLISTLNSSSDEAP